MWKRRAYLIAFPLGGVVTVVALVFNPPAPTLFNRILTPGIGLFCLLLAAALVAGMRTKWVERAGAIGLVSYFGARMAHDLFVLLPEQTLEAIGQTQMWYAPLFVIIFVMLELRPAVLLSLFLYTATLVLGTIRLGLGFEIEAGVLHGLVQQFVFANGVAIVLLTSLSVLKPRLSKAQELALTDSLTGLPNRRHMEDFCERAMARAIRGGVPLSVVMIDVDYFKRVNDTLGHEEGDRVLKQVAVLLRQALRTGDEFGRHGGEEFLAVLPQTRAEEAVLVAERLRQAVEANTDVTISLGVSTHHVDDDPAALIRRADDAMYEAKRAGRNRVCANKWGLHRRGAGPLGAQN